MPELPFIKDSPIQMTSCNAMTRAREVSFTNVMISLEMGGTIRLIICSRVMWRKIWALVMPKTWPASCWPFGTPWMPPR